MRETVGEWKKEWIDTNGETNKLEVSIEDSSLDEFAPPIYEGSFAGIPEALEEKKVIDWGQICESSVRERVGAYTLTIETTMEKLKACPFCGKQAISISVPETGSISGDMGTRTTIMCENRECGVKIVKWALNREWAEESAVRAWNLRTII